MSDLQNETPCQETIAKHSFRDLNFTCGLTNPLHRRGIYTVEEVLSLKSGKDLLSLNGLGPRRAYLILKLMGNAGYNVDHLKDPVIMREGEREYPLSKLMRMLSELKPETQDKITSMIVRAYCEEVESTKDI